MSGAVFKKLMAEMRNGGMYLYSSKLPPGHAAAGSRSMQMGMFDKAGLSSADISGEVFMKSIGRSRAEVADTIERFVDGSCGRWDWDDFCCVPIIDPQLDSIRARCTAL